MLDFLKNILLILGGIIGCFIAIKIHEVLKKQASDTSKEKFVLSKFASGMLDIFSPVGWAKDIYSLLNLRKLIVYTIIIVSIFGYGLYRGKINKPVQLAISEEVEFTIPVPNSNLALYHPKHSTELQWINLETGKVVSKVKVKDIPELKKLLKPYGFQFKPFVTAGGSLGENKTGFEAGAGIDFFKWYKLNANAFVTNLGGYLGVGYNITDNFDVMVGAGKGWKGDNRIGLFGKWKF